MILLVAVMPLAPEVSILPDVVLVTDEMTDEVAITPFTVVVSVLPERD
jgi:hypothetical protein